MRRLIPLVALAGCTTGGAPALRDPGDQRVAVGQTLVLDLYATDPDGDELSYAFAAHDVPDLDATASLSTAPDGHAVFTLSPRASQVGRHVFDFSVSDGEHDATLSLEIAVEPVIGAAPIFHKPLSEGTVLDLQHFDCAAFDIEVEDLDTPVIDLGLGRLEPRGAALTVEASGLTGRWSWCPDAEQRLDHQVLVSLRADDHDNPPTLKDFVVVVRAPPGACGGDGPVIEHAPRDVTSMQAIAIQAEIRDEDGLAEPPLVLYAYEDPGDPIQFDKLDRVATMGLVDGDMHRGTWRGSIPNPGESAPIWYLIQALDDGKTCSNRTDHPAAGTHRILLTYGGSSACEDDEAEDDDNRAQADALGSVEDGTYAAVSCPGDPDWYLVDVDARTRLEVVLSGPPAPANLDLALTDASGDVLHESAGPSANEGLTTSCLAAGKHYLRVRGPGAQEAAPYTLTVDFTACAADDASCCTVHAGPGCDDAAVEACVCAADDFCCADDGAWDEVCVIEVGEQLCGPACVPDDDDGACCEVNGTAGCEVDTVEYCVCAEDPLCCAADPGWDEACVLGIEEYGCGICPGG